MLTSTWHTSTWSLPQGQNCVQARATEAGVEVRDSKDRGAGPVLTFTADEWSAFLGGAKTGEFDIS